MQLRRTGTLAFWIAALLAWPAEAADDMRCEALFVVGSELWSAGETAPARMIVRDERGVHEPRWSPSGKRVAYVHDFEFAADAASALVVADAGSGEVVRMLPIRKEHGINAVLQLGWLDENTIWTEGHVTPSSGIYHEWDVKSGEARRETWGSWFAPSADRGVAHLGHIPHGAPPRHARPRVMLGDRMLYEGTDVAGGLAWLGNEVVLVDRANGETSLVAVDATRGTVTSRVPLRGVGRVRHLSALPDKRGVLLETSDGFVEADLRGGAIRNVTEAPRLSRPMYMDVGQKRLTDAAAAPGRTVAAEQVRCSSSATY